MTTAHLLSTIPIAEIDARVAAPLRWDIATPHGTIKMVVPLFSFYRLRAWSRAISGLRLTIQLGETSGLLGLEDILKRAETSTEIRSEWTNAIEVAQEQFGALPADLCELLMLVSDPLDPADAIDALLDWSAESGIAVPVPAVGDMSALRLGLSTLAAHCLPVDDAIRLVDQIRDAMQSVKKKLGEAEARPEPAQSPKRRLFRDLFARLTKATP